MKKKIILLLIMLFIPFISVNADTLYKVSMEVDLQKDGSANIQEVWDVEGTDGSEWYKQVLDLGNSKLSDFKVSMDGKPLTKKDVWNIDGDLSSKRGYYGINYISNGLELCFGKGDYNRHTFVLNYKISNYIFNTEDAQVLYATMFPRVYANSFYVKVKSYYEFPDTLDVWGYGYRGYAYVKDGVIEMSEGEDLSNEYVVLLAKFPLGTFETNNTGNFNTFDEVLAEAEKGTTGKYEGGNYDSDTASNIIGGIINFLFWVIFIVIGIKAGKQASKNNIVLKFGETGNKVRKDVPNFREIPCNKDLYRAYFIASQYKMNPKKENLLGAIILKWIKDGNARVEAVETKKLLKTTTENNIIFVSEPNSVPLETDLYRWMYDASKDGKLESNEFSRWCSSHYTKMLEWFNSVLRYERDELVKEGKVKMTEKGKVFKSYQFEADPSLMTEAEQLTGLKNFLVEFSRIEERQPIEVNLWNEYLIFAQIFGIAKEVAKQFEKLYPEIVEYMNQSGNIYTNDTFIFVDNISRTGISSARRSAEAAARSYSSGGGGFSSGGGGGGSFGGGGGGSMGGR